MWNTQRIPLEADDMEQQIASEIVQEKNFILMLV